MCTFIQVPSHKPYTYIIFNHLVLFALAVFVLNFWGVTVMKHYPMSERQIKKFSVLLHHQIESMKETELRQCLWKDKVFNRNSLHALAIIETYFTRLLPSSFIWTLSLLWYLLNEQFIITMPLSCAVALKYFSPFTNPVSRCSICCRRQCKVYYSAWSFHMCCKG